ncbi:MAG: hypothetical protein ACRDXX_08610 [Stackebrandtia sp.]
MRAMGPDDRPAVERILREDDREQEWLSRAALEFSCFGLAEWDGRLQVSRHSRSPMDGLVNISLTHDRDDGARVEVRTTRRDARDEARLMRAGSRPSREEAIAALRDDSPLEPGRPIVLPIDGEAVDFEKWGDEPHWLAAVTHAGRGVAVEAQGVPVADVRLTRVASLEPYFAHRNAMMRMMRDHLDGTV